MTDEGLGLAAVARDGSRPPEARLAAVAALTDAMPRGLLEPVAIALLHDADPRLRGHGMILCARLYLDAIEPLVRVSFEDDACFREGDVDVSLGHLARATCQVLLGGRPEPEFPPWSAVAVEAPPPVVDAMHEPDDDIDLHYLAARQWILRLAPETLGLSRPSLPRNVFGIVMETGYPPGTHTLACLLDGTVYNDLSNGVIDHGMGRHAEVREAAQDFIARAQLDWDAAARTRRFERPAVGMVRFFFLGAYEIRILEADERLLLDRVDPAAELYHAAHAVLSEIHAIELAAGDIEPE